MVGALPMWGASVLAELVKKLPDYSHPGLLVGTAPFDDAAVLRLTEEIALVSTTDFFPPLVDDPADFGGNGRSHAASHKADYLQ